MRILKSGNISYPIEGFFIKSVDDLIFDEGQNLDLEQWVTAGESQSFTNGKFVVAGIGGYMAFGNSPGFASSLAVGSALSQFVERRYLR